MIQRVAEVGHKSPAGRIAALAPLPAELLMKQVDQAPLAVVEPGLAPGAVQCDQVDTATLDQKLVRVGEAVGTKGSPREFTTTPGHRSRLTPPGRCCTDFSCSRRSTMACRICTRNNVWSACASEATSLGNQGSAVAKHRPQEVDDHAHDAHCGLSVRVMWGGIVAGKHVERETRKSRNRRSSASRSAVRLRGFF